MQESGCATPARRPRPGWVDIHHHFFPPRYVSETLQNIVGAIAGAVPMSIATEWSPQRAVEQMDAHGIGCAWVSMAPPGVWFGDREQTRSLARLCNEYAAQMVADFPGCFEIFAALPLPDVEASLREIQHTFDVLKFRAVGLPSNYRTTWPGDPAYAEVFDELNRRGATVYIHPTVPEACDNLVPGVPGPSLEFPFDTTRAIISFLFNGTFSRCPNVRFIFSHGGGTMPFLAHRVCSFLDRYAGHASVVPIMERLPRGPEYELKRLYYDVTSVASPTPMAALRDFVPLSQILFGTDYPFLPVAKSAGEIRDLGFTSDELERIGRSNSLTLLGTEAD